MYLDRYNLRYLIKIWYYEVGVTYICGHLCVTSLLLCICSPCLWVLIIIVLHCGGQLLNITFSFSSSRRFQWTCYVLIRISCYRVIDVMLLGYVCCTKLIQTRITVCSVSFLLLLPELTYRAAAAAHPLQFEVSRCRTSQFARGFLPAHVRTWNDLPSPFGV